MYQFIFTCEGVLHSGFFSCPSETFETAYQWFLAFILVGFPSYKMIKFISVSEQHFCLIDGQKINL